MPETRTKRKQTETELVSELETELVKSPANTEAAPAKPFGRPSEYTEALAEEICSRIIQGEPLVRICRDDHMPHVVTVYRWLSRFNNFRNMYTQAKEEQADTLAEEIQDIADQMPMEKTDGNGNTSFDAAYINWMRLRVDARKWVAAKLKPRKYGDRVALAGDEDNPLKVEASIEAKGLFNELLHAIETGKQAAK